MIGVWSSPIEILLVVVLINHQHLTVAKTDFSCRCLDRRHFASPLDAACYYCPNNGCRISDYQGCRERDQ